MNLGIKGKTALVVGSSKNIGRDVVRKLTEEGCLTLKASRTEGIDLMPEGAAEAFCNDLIDQGRTPDIIVHAIGGSNGVTDIWGSAEDYAKVWRLNLGIAIDINRVFAPMMKAKGWGRIVHFSSVAVTANIGYCPYASAKWAVEGYVKSMSKELSPHGVVMSAVRPGAFPYPGRYLHDMPKPEQDRWIEKHIPQGRFGFAEECAKVVAFLCGEGASYMAGAVVPVDGGHR